MINRICCNIAFIVCIILPLLSAGQTNDSMFLYRGSNPEIISARPVAKLPEALDESSGLYVSNPNRLWSHNDSGNTNEIFCFDTTGALLRVLTISNATNVDWEDLAMDDQKRLYICDAGNNFCDRTDLVIYRIPEPESVSGNQVIAESITFIFDDQYLFPPPDNNLNYDIEAMIWKSDTLFLFTKNRSIPQTGICKMYSLPAIPGFHVAKLEATIFLATENQEARVTAADIHPETGELLLLTRTKIVSFTNYPANRFFDGLMSEHYFDTQMGQIEAIAFVDDYRVFLTEEIIEGKSGFLYNVPWESATSLIDQKKSELKIYPNPFTSEIIIQKPVEKPIQIMIWDVKGNLVFQTTKTERIISLEKLNTGVYLISITFENQTSAFRVVKK
jgi:hypothetical protein